MPPKPDASDSAAARRLALRMRPDLTLVEQRYGPDRYWLVKDPVALRYFHLGEEEHAILRMLDGRTSLAEIKRRFEEAFAPWQVTFEQLHAFLSRLYESGLLLAEAAGQGEPLLQRHARQRRRAWLDLFGNLLAIRFGGVDPDRFLQWLYPKCRWLFSAGFLTACAALVLAAAVLAAVQFDTLRSKLPEFPTFFRAGNLVWFAVALAAAKCLHELGHALTCRHFGGRCHEIGVLLLVFTPCLYCNVSDAWSFPGKWQRIAVSASGVLVEVVLAAACTFLWWFSNPGLFNTLMLSMVVVCSVNTLVFNGNPLLRYDGYYVLADLLEVPNLSQQSRALVNRWLARLALGLDLPPDRSLPRRRRWLVALYGVASSVYRWLVVIAILWFCYRLLKPHGLEPVAQVLALLVIAGMAATPVRSLVMFLRHPGTRRRVDRGRAWASLVAAAALVAGAMVVPLPFRVSAPAVIQPAGACHVYVVVPGTLQRAARPGDIVEKGRELGRLVNLDMRAEIAELTGQRNQQRLELEHLRLRLNDDPAIAGEIPPAEEALADIESRLRQRQIDQQRLVLRAPAAGTVLPPPQQPAPSYAPGALRAWQGSPLDERNAGSWLETGTLFCLVGDPTRREAFLVIDQSDVTFVRRGQRVRLQLDQTPGAVLEGTIAEVAQTEVKVAPRELAGQSDLLVRRDAQGVARPVETSYQARVVLDHHDHRLLVGTRGRAKVLVEPLTLGQRAWRFVQRLFRFRL